MMALKDSPPFFKEGQKAKRFGVVVCKTYFYRLNVLRDG